MPRRKSMATTRYSSKIGRGVTQSIQCLDEENFSPTQLESRFQAWQEVGKECEELQIPLSCLRAAVDLLRNAMGGE